MEISAKTQLIGVVGNPVKHSLSPKIHNYLAERLNLDYVYTAFEPSSFQNIPDSLRLLGIRGVNVTAPFKTDAMNACDLLSNEAKLCESVNTIVNENGVLKGYSTDGEGLYRFFKYRNIDVLNKKILVLGAGGVSKAVCVMLKNHGVAGVYVLNRTEQKACALVDSLNDDMNTDIFSVYNNEDDYQIIINATSVGLGTDETPVSKLSMFNCAETAVDLIYYPRKTKFLYDAESMGLKVYNGIGMLVYQAVIAFEYFTGANVPDEICGEVMKLINE